MALDAPVTRIGAWWMASRAWDTAASLVVLAGIPWTPGKGGRAPGIPPWSRVSGAATLPFHTKERQHMNHRKLSTTLAILAAAAGVSAFSASAQAVTLDSDSTSLTTDPEVTLTPATISFGFSGGLVTPTLTGTIRAVNADDACVRARVDSYDGAALLHSEHGVKHCLTDDLAHAWPVNLHGYSNALIDRVEVAVEKENTQGWSTVDDREHTMKTFTDLVTVFGTGVDLGGLPYAGGAPTFGASVSWPIANGLVTPKYDGYVHFEGFSRCGRVDLRIKDENGVQLAEVPGAQHCPPDLAHYAYRDTLNSYTSPLATQVEVRLETKTGGTWNKVSSKTVSIAE